MKPQRTAQSDFPNLNKYRETILKSPDFFSLIKSASVQHCFKKGAFCKTFEHALQQVFSIKLASYYKNLLLSDSESFWWTLDDYWMKQTGKRGDIGSNAFAVTAADIANAINGLKQTRLYAHKLVNGYLLWTTIGEFGLIDIKSGTDCQTPFGRVMVEAEIVINDDIRQLYQRSRKKAAKARAVTT